MILPKEAIDEFRAIYKKVYGKDISFEEASFRAHNLIKLYKAVLGNSSIDITNPNSNS